jgi:hypothetical protein
MTAALKFLAFLCAGLLLCFAIRDIVVFGMGISSSAAHAPSQLWDALGDAVAWSRDYKEGATAIFLVCIALLYIGRKNR